MALLIDRCQEITASPAVVGATVRCRKQCKEPSLTPVFQLPHTFGAFSAIPAKLAGNTAAKFTAFASGVPIVVIYPL